jgi:hypothetical protein
MDKGYSQVLGTSGENPGDDRCGFNAALGPDRRRWWHAMRGSWDGSGSGALVPGVGGVIQ